MVLLQQCRRKGDFVFCQCCWGIEASLKNSQRQGGNDEMKFGHDVLDRKPQIFICSGECETVLPPACVRAHPACSISAHLARSIRINCISARERARWIEGEGERFSPSVGLVLLQGESFKILPPMWLLVFTLMTPSSLPTFYLMTFLDLELQAQFPMTTRCWYTSYLCMYTNK